MNVTDSFQGKAEFFKALGHPTRLFIIHCIKDKRHSVSDLTEMVGIDISTMSKHLDSLKKQGIIRGEKVKNQVFYSLTIPCVLEFMSCTDRAIKNNKEN